MAQTSKEGHKASHSHCVHLAICGNCECLLDKFITAICISTKCSTYKDKVIHQMLNKYRISSWPNIRPFFNIRLRQKSCKLSDI